MMLLLKPMMPSPKRLKLKSKLNLTPLLKLKLLKKSLLILLIQMLKKELQRLTSMKQPKNQSLKAKKQTLQVFTASNLELMAVSVAQYNSMGTKELQCSHSQAKLPSAWEYTGGDKIKNTELRRNISSSKLGNTTPFIDSIPKWKMKWLLPRSMLDQAQEAPQEKESEQLITALNRPMPE